MEGRELLTVDEAQVRQQVKRAADALVQRAGIDVRPPWPVL